MFEDKTYTDSFTIGTDYSFGDLIHTIDVPNGEIWLLESMGFGAINTDGGTSVDAGLDARSYAPGANNRHVFRQRVYDNNWNNGNAHNHGDVNYYISSNENFEIYLAGRQTNNQGTMDYILKIRRII
ncbi:MAG: hypothetical protein ACI8Z7_000419 [Candidatus Nanohaloarchaea archaeon]|jgi:hypothetical protein